MFKEKIVLFAPYIICSVFFIAYALLSITRHLHFESYGFDLGIADQIVWKYSHFMAPVTTVQYYPFTSLLTDHTEFIYIFLAPFYWIYSSPITLLILQAGLIAFSGLPIFWLSKKKKIITSLSLVIMIAYLSFYGIQNAIWFDVHSISFGIAMLPWFLYFLDAKKKLWALVTLLLAIMSKEDVALITLSICAVYFIKERSRLALALGIISVAYLIFIFFVYFPHFTQDGYRYANPNGMLSDIKLEYLYNSQDKLDVYSYSFGWFGFLSLLSPLYLLPAIGDLIHYFVLGNHLSATHGLFMHYRASLALLMVLPFIMTIHKYKKLNTIYVAGLLIIIIVVLQYKLHVPLTYLSKSWFWKTPENTVSISNAINKIPLSASVVAQNNLVPHVSQRDQIFTLWPEKKQANKNIQCGGATSCDWFRWAGNPKYLLIDTSGAWDIRHLLSNREDYLKSIDNLEKGKYIRVAYEEGTTTLYTIDKNPNIK